MEEEQASKVYIGVAFVLLLMTILAMALPSFLFGLTFVDVVALSGPGAASAGAGGSFAVFVAIVVAEVIAILASLYLIFILYKRSQGEELTGCAQPGVWACVAGILSLFPFVYTLAVYFPFIGFLIQGGGLICAALAAVLGCGIGIKECFCKSGDQEGNGKALV